MMTDRTADRFAREIEACLDKLFRAAFRLTRHEADARELVQETCVRAFASRRQWLRTQSRLSWLMRVQYNLFIDSTRRNAREKTDRIDDTGTICLQADSRFEPDHCAEQSEEFELLQRAWRELSRDQQAVLGLRAEGYTLKEMREITGCGTEVLGVRLHRARKKLAKLYAEQEAARTTRTMEIHR